MISLSEITDVFVGLQVDADRNFIDFDAERLYSAFLEQSRIVSKKLDQDDMIDCCLNRLNYAYEEIKRYYIQNGVNE